MNRAYAAAVAILATVLVPMTVRAEPLTFTAVASSVARFTVHVPSAETVVGTVRGPRGAAGPGFVTATLVVDPAKPQETSGKISVDLGRLTTGVDMRDAHIRGKEYLDVGGGAVNRFAVFEVRRVDIVGPLAPNTLTPAKVEGILTIKGKPVTTTADVRITYVKPAADSVTTARTAAETGDVLRVQVAFHTSFTNHGMSVPEVLFLKATNGILMEADLTLVHQ